MMRRETCWDMVTLVKNTDCDEPWVVTARRGSCSLFIQSANCCLTLALCLDRSFRVAYCNLFHRDFAVSDGGTAYRWTWLGMSIFDAKAYSNFALGLRYALICVRLTRIQDVNNRL